MYDPLNARLVADVANTVVEKFVQLNGYNDVLCYIVTQLLDQCLSHTKSSLIELITSLISRGQIDS